MNKRGSPVGSYILPPDGRSPGTKHGPSSIATTGVYWKPVWHMLDGRALSGRREPPHHEARSQWDGAAVILAEILPRPVSAAQEPPGPKKATLAVAASMLTDVYHMLRNGSRVSVAPCGTAEEDLGHPSAGDG